MSLSLEICVDEESQHRLTTVLYSLLIALFEQTSKVVAIKEAFHSVLFWLCVQVLLNSSGALKVTFMIHHRTVYYRVLGA